MSNALPFPRAEGAEDEHIRAELVKWHLAGLDTKTACALVRLIYEILKYRWAEAIRAPHLESYRCEKLASHDFGVAKWTERLTKAGRRYGLDVSVLQSASQEQLDSLARRFLPRVTQHERDLFGLVELHYAQIGLPYFRDGRNLSEGRQDPNDHMSQALIP